MLKRSNAFKSRKSKFKETRNARKSKIGSRFGPQGQFQEFSKEQIEELGKWEIQSEQIDVIRQFLRLDAYGRMSVKTLIQREFLRCLEQGTDQDISNIKIGIKTVSGDDKAPHTA